MSSLVRRFMFHSLNLDTLLPVDFSAPPATLKKLVIPHLHAGRGVLQLSRLESVLSLDTYTAFLFIGI